MATTVKHRFDDYDSLRPDLTGREDIPMANSRGGEPVKPTRSGALVMLVIGVLLMLIAIVVGTGGALFPGP
jgi:hypothetical protein